MASKVVKAACTNIDKGIRISIAVKGIGIDKDVQRFIFDKFYRAAGGNLHDVKGFGLGLTCVKEIVDAHRGMVSVSSSAGEGSQFDLYFKNC